MLDENSNTKLKPLLRLKIDHTGYPVIKSISLNAIFSEQIANPSDFLQWHKKNEIVRKVRKPGQNDCCESDDGQDDEDLNLQAQYGNYKNSAKYDLKSYLIKSLASETTKKVENPMAAIDPVDLV